MTKKQQLTNFVNTTFSRQEVRSKLRKMGLPTGHQKQDSVRNLVEHYLKEGK